MNNKDTHLDTVYLVFSGQNCVEQEQLSDDVDEIQEFGHEIESREVCAEPTRKTRKISIEVQALHDQEIRSRDLDQELEPELWVGVGVKQNYQPKTSLFRVFPENVVLVGVPLWAPHYATKHSSFSGS